MLRQHPAELLVPTRGRGFYDLTGELNRIVAESRMQTGVLTVHLRHTSASLVIQENADPDVRVDLEAFFQRMVPDGDPLFVHTSEGDDDMSAHIRTALTAVNLSIPVWHGALTLGTWQAVYLCEHRTNPHRRSVVVHLMGE